MIGILGGPIGVLLGGSTGMLAGNLVDAGDAKNTASLIETVAAKMIDGEVSLIILAEEEDESELDMFMKDFQVEIIRFDAAVIAAEVEEAQEMQKEMERQARIKLRETKKEEHKSKIEENRKKLAADIEAFKAKFKKYVLSGLSVQKMTGSWEYLLPSSRCLCILPNRDTVLTG
jgi:hypothetical protein